MIPTVQQPVLDRVTRRVPIGLRVWDMATASCLIDGLEITIGQEINTLSEKRFISLSPASMNHGGVYYAFGIPRLIDRFEFNDDEDKAWENIETCHYQIRVRDPANRFLPVIFDVDLPIRGLLHWKPKSSNQQLRTLLSNNGFLLEKEVNDSAVFQQIPLFSSVSRTVPDSLAVVYAELREGLAVKVFDKTDEQEFKKNQVAAWSLLTVSVDNEVLGIGLADEKGQVTIFFPYPKQPTPKINAQRSGWKIKLIAYYQPWWEENADGKKEIPENPNLTQLLEQVASTAQEIPLQQELEYKKPFTVCATIKNSNGT